MIKLNEINKILSEGSFLKGLELAKKLSDDEKLEALKEFRNISKERKDLDSDVFLKVYELLMSFGSKEISDKALDIINWRGSGILKKEFLFKDLTVLMEFLKKTLKRLNSFLHLLKDIEKAPVRIWFGDLRGFRFYPEGPVYNDKYDMDILNTDKDMILIYLYEDSVEVEDLSEAFYCYAYEILNLFFKGKSLNSEKYLSCIEKFFKEIKEKEITVVEL